MVVILSHMVHDKITTVVILSRDRITTVKDKNAPDGNLFNKLIHICCVGQLDVAVAEDEW